MGILRHWKPLLVVAVLALGALVYVGQARWRDRCGADVAEISADDLGTVLGDPGGLDPEMVAALESLGPPFGEVVAGTEFESFMHLPTVGVVDDATVYLAAGGGLLGDEYDGSLAVVDVATGEGRWGIGVRGYGAGGGVVGDSLVTLGIPEDRAPQLAAYDLESGERQHCSKLGGDTETGYDPPLASTAVGDGEVVVARKDEDDGGSLVVTRLDPRTGDEAWSGTAPYTSSDLVMEDAGDVVLVGGERGYAALDAADGSTAWSLPGGELVGADPETGLSYLVDGARVVAVDATGEEAWSAKLPGDYCDAALWDDRLITSCGRPVLSALDAATGEELWDSPTELDIAGGVITMGDDRSADLGDGTRLQLANDGLLRVDTDTGVITPVITRDDLGECVSGVEPVGDHLVLSTETGVFVLTRE